MGRLAERRICNENMKTVIYQMRLYSNVTYQSYTDTFYSSFPHLSGDTILLSVRLRIFTFIQQTYNIYRIILVAIETKNQSIYSLCLSYNQSILYIIIYI